MGGVVRAWREAWRSVAGGVAEGVAGGVVLGVVLGVAFLRLETWFLTQIIAVLAIFAPLGDCSPTFLSPTHLQATMVVGAHRFAEDWLQGLHEKRRPATL